jgi:cobalt-zinc-cadmium resistance protein CzcA
MLSAMQHWRVERPIFFSLLILVSAYIPLFTLERVERRLFTPMAFTVCAALTGSLLVSLTLVPVLATYLFPSKFPTWENPLLKWLTERYERVLNALMPRPRAVLLGATAIVVGALRLQRQSKPSQMVLNHPKSRRP